MLDSAAGTVVTFYSYKGGAGRSMALANTAWLLASNARRVLVVDWDLEAPGLHRYFHPFLHDPELRSTPGIMDMIWDFAVTVMSPQGPGEEDWFERSTTVTPYAASLNWSFPSGGTIDFVCSGRHDSAYSRRVNTFDWSGFYTNQGGGEFVDALGRDMRSSYDWILIDSRTGLSDTAGICTVQLPDIVVNCFTLNTQSIEGAAAVARSIAAQAEGREIRLLPVPMRVEDGEQRKLEMGRDVARAAFDPFLRWLGAQEKERYWGDVEVPYKPYYAYEEILAVFGDRPLQEGTLLAAYERLASYLTGGSVDALPAQDEALRRRHLAVFERTQVSIPAEVVISYVWTDRLWADWVAGELENGGFRATLDQIGPGVVPREPSPGAVLPQSSTGTRRAVVIVSSAYTRTPAAVERWREAASVDPDGAQRLLVPVRIDDAQLPREFSERDHADLLGLDEPAARQVLLTAAGRPTRPVTEPVTRSGSAVARFPGAPPQIWEGVPARNPTFVGREALLMALHDQFLGMDEEPVHTQVLQGLAGVGKTQVAAEYAFRFGAFYDLVYWIGCDQAALVRSGLAHLARDLGVPHRHGREPVEEVVNALRTGVPYRRWLLVFDNADTPEEIMPLIPHGPGRVLITSRNRRWQGRQSRVEIGVFTRDESVALLLRRAPGLTASMATRLAQALGDLPLALEHAGAWHAETGMPADRYIELLDSSRGPLLLEGEIPTYPRSVARTWLLSVERLRARVPAAARLAELCAFFGPDPISLQLFAGDGLRDLADREDQSLRDPIALAAAVRNVGEHALARVDPASRSLEMHRLVQSVIRGDLTPEARNSVRERVQALLAAADPLDPERPEHWPRYAVLRPHLQPAGALRSRAEEVSRLVRNLVRSLYMQRDHSGCRDLARRALGVWREHFGEDDERTLELALDLADSLRALGEAEEAHSLDSDAHDRLVGVLGPNHPLALRAAMALGGDLRSIGDYQGARRLDEDTYARYRETAGLDDPETIRTANNLAVSLRFVGDFRLAFEMGQDAYDRQRRACGDDHILTLQYADSHARDLRELGRYRESLDLLDRTLENSRRVLGEDHPDTLRAMRDLAVSMRRAGRTDQARRLSEDAFTRFRAHVGDSQPGTLAAAVSLIGDMCLAGEVSAARDLAEDTYQRARSRLGAENLYTLAAANSLVVATRLGGDPSTAADLARQTAALLRTVLTDSHPFVFCCAVNLANCLFDVGQVAGARDLDEDAWSGLRAQLGDGHPAALMACANLATDQRTLGDGPAAETLHSTVLAELGENLGENHPTMSALRSGRRADLDIDPPPP